jgi:hypothetical protein
MSSNGTMLLSFFSFLDYLLFWVLILFWLWGFFVLGFGFIFLVFGGGFFLWFFFGFWGFFCVGGFFFFFGFWAVFLSVLSVVGFGSFGWRCRVKMLRCPPPHRPTAGFQ